MAILWIGQDDHGSQMQAQESPKAGNWEPGRSAFGYAADTPEPSFAASSCRSSSLKGGTPTAYSNSQLRAGDGDENATLLDSDFGHLFGRQLGLVDSGSDERSARGIKNAPLERGPRPLHQDPSYLSDEDPTFGQVLLEVAMMAVLMAVLWLGWLTVCALN